MNLTSDSSSKIASLKTTTHNNSLYQAIEHKIQYLFILFALFVLPLMIREYS